jgi:hypothetical protein
MSKYSAQVRLEMNIEVDADSEEEAVEAVEDLIYRYINPHAEYVDTPDINVVLIEEDDTDD